LAAAGELQPLADAEEHPPLDAKRNDDREAHTPLMQTMSSPLDSGPIVKPLSVPVGAGAELPPNTGGGVWSARGADTSVRNTNSANATKNFMGPNSN
jgi:hypothetical protein